MSKLCHELRTPLQVLNGYLDILSEDCGDQLPAEPLRILKRLRLSTTELTQTVENLLEYAASLAGTQATIIEAIEIADLVAELAPGFEAADARKQISLRWSIEGNLSRIHSDRRLLRSIVSNLVYNAIKFTERGSVAVSLRPIRVNGKFAIELEVTDTGIGIEKERLDEAFQPFVQLSDSNTRNHRGLGLGLALVRRNAKSLGATLDLKSKPTQGTCVRVRFPQGARA